MFLNVDMDINKTTKIVVEHFLILSNKDKDNIGFKFYLLALKEFFEISQYK